MRFEKNVKWGFSDSPYTDTMKVFPVNLRSEEMDICKNLPKLWGLSWISLYANWEASFISSFFQEWRENLQSSDVWLCLLQGMSFKMKPRFLDVVKMRLDNSGLFCPGESCRGTGRETISRLSHVFPPIWAKQDVNKPEHKCPSLIHWTVQSHLNNI